MGAQTFVGGGMVVWPKFQKGDCVRLRDGSYPWCLCHGRNGVIEHVAALGTRINPLCPEYVIQLDGGLSFAVRETDIDCSVVK